MVAERPVDDAARRGAGGRRPPPSPDAVGFGSSADRPMSGGAPTGVEEGVPQDVPIIAPSLLVPGEIIVKHWKPALWYVVFVSLPVLAAGLALVVLAFAVNDLPPTWQHGLIRLAATVAAVRVAVAILQWIGRTYVLTDRRILTQSGVVDVQVECMGLEQIESTFVAQAAAQRWLGIGTIFFSCGVGRHDSMAWEQVGHPREVHAHIIAQIDRWKRSQPTSKPD